MYTDNLKNKLIDNGLQINDDLRGILKNNSMEDDDDKFVDTILKACLIILIIFYIIPIIIIDLYFGFTNDSCLTLNLYDTYFNLKIYLLVSGFIHILILSGLFFWLLNIIKKYYNTYNIIYFVVSLFNLLWNIIGEILFWGYIYEKNICDDLLSKYIFVTLIMKIISSSVLAYKSYKNIIF